jgi:hypothetical protein
LLISARVVASRWLDAHGVFSAPWAFFVYSHGTATRAPGHPACGWLAGFARLRPAARSPTVVLIAKLQAHIENDTLSGGPAAPAPRDESASMMQRAVPLSKLTNAMLVDIPN